MSRILPLVLLLAVIVSSCSAQGSATTSSAGAVTTVIIVRHAEAASGPGDPSLTEAGRQRAETLAEALAGAGVDAIYTSQFARTKETAGPLAAATGITITPIPAESATINEYGRAIAAEIRRRRAGLTVLVVGHSNTVPQLVEALTGRAVAEIVHDEHDRLYVVSLTGDAAGSLVAARYGAARPGR